MQRRTFLSVSLALGAGGAIAGAAGSPPGAPAASVARDPDPLVARVAQAALTMQRLSWEQGILAQAFLELGDEAMVVRMARSSLMHTTADGRMAAIGGSTTDPGMGGAAYWMAAQRTGDPLLKKGADNLLDYLLKRAGRAADGTLYHSSSPEMWSDTFNTSAPFFAAAGRYDDAIRQVEGCHRRLWNPEKKLYAHIWNDSRQRFSDPLFWGVGCGWAASAMTRVIRALPGEKQEARDRLAAMLKSLLDGCLALQRPDGMFHNIVDRPDTFVEVNLAQMLAFSIYTSVQGGWLPREYLKAADRMRQAARGKVDRYGFVQDVCGAPSFNAPGIAPEGQAAFLMMEAAAGKMVK